MFTNSTSSSLSFIVSFNIAHNFQEKENISQNPPSANNISNKPKTVQIPQINRTNPTFKLRVHSIYEVVT